MNWMATASVGACLSMATLSSQESPSLDHPDQPQRVKVVSWNVLYGFNHGRSISEGERWIDEQRPDVLALQELNGFTHESLEGSAKRFGHPYAVLQKENGFSLGLTSTAPIDVLERRVEGFHHGYLHCRTHGIEFFVVHFWPGKEHEVAAVLEKANGRAGTGASVMILGDFNSHSAKDASRLASQPIRSNFDAVEQVEEGGFVDAVHRFDRGAAYSFPSPVTIPKWSKDMEEVRSMRQRIDFIFADDSLARRLRSATIVQSDELDAISDHYPVVAELAVDSSSAPQGPPDFAFGVIADCQYCNAPPMGKRRYSESRAKLVGCVEHLNSLDLAYTVSLGDLIDRDFESLDAILPIFDRLLSAKYHVLGNHDYEVKDERKAEVPKRLGMAANYYAFAMDGWRFVVLDGNDISLHAHVAGTPAHVAAAEYRRTRAPGAPLWNGAIGGQQLEWFDRTLSQADEAGERVVVLCHFPVFPENVHNLWNADEVLAVIARHACVKAYLNGHNHAGNYGVKDGVHFLTFQGMVDTKHTSYAAVNVHPEHLSVLGFGRERDRTLKIR